MYRFVTFLVFALFTASAAGATETVSPDGRWWTDLSTSSKVDVIVAATDAYRAGYQVGDANGFIKLLDAVLKTQTRLHWTDAQTMKFSNALSIEQKAQGRSVWPDFSGKAIQAYIDGLDYFYSNHPNAVAVNIGDVLPCLQNNATITCDKIANAK
jgi:hypothetical protein